MLSTDKPDSGFESDGCLACDIVAAVTELVAKLDETTIGTTVVNDGSSVNDKS